MMYSEFVDGTGCRENEHNYNVFKNLEAMYMNTDMSKEEVYEYGKKLVDNSKPQELIDFENEINAEIEMVKRQLEWYKEDMEWRKSRLDDLYDDECRKMYKNEIKYDREQVKACRVRIKELKWVLV